MSDIQAEPLKRLIDLYLKEVYQGSAHQLRKGVLGEFLEWVKEREEVEKLEAA